MEANELIEKISQDFSDSILFLEENSKISEKNNLEVLQTKVSILTIGTYIENKTYEIILDILKNGETEILTEFLHNQALTRKFHSMFDFNSNNINKFFKLFGNSFLTFMKKKVDSDQEYKSCIDAFLLLCVKRNVLAHENFYLTSIDLTLNEVKEKTRLINIFFIKFKVYTKEFIDEYEHTIT